MRLHFTLSPNTEPVPFAYQHKLTGVFHKWLKNNDLHDKISLYSLSWLDGSRRVRNKLEFPNGGKWFVSFFEDKYVERLVEGALRDPEMFCGMQVTAIKQQITPDFGTKQIFKVASPVFIKGKQINGNHPHHYLWNEPEADEILTKTLIHKMDVANQDANKEIFTDKDREVKVSFDREYEYPKTKLVRILKYKKGNQIAIDHRTNICPVIVKGTSEAVRFAWSVGVGGGTGSCFGSLW